MDVQFFMKRITCSVLIAMLALVVLPVSPVRAETGGYTHVISKTATGLIDIAYTPEHVIFATNVIPSVPATSYVYYGGESTGVAAPDGSVSFPIKDSMPATQRGRPVASGIDVARSSPPVAPGFTGLGLQMYQVYDPSGSTMVARIYVQFWYGNGALTSISVNTQSVSTGPGPGCTPAPGRPCKQPNSAGSAH